MQDCRYKLFFLMTLFVMTPVLANQDDEISETLPSLELLEYLGQLVELDEELIGPELFDVDEETQRVEEPGDTATPTEAEAPQQGEVRHG